MKTAASRNLQSSISPTDSGGGQRGKTATGKRPAQAMTADFISGQPLFELVNPPVNEKGVFLQFASASPNGTHMPILSNPDGKSSLICLPSAVGHTFNKCNLAQCLRNQKSCTRNPKYRTPDGPPPFCHVDFLQPYWANQPEIFWAPVVQFLRLPGVSASIRPSEFLKAKTPSTPW